MERILSAPEPLPQPLLAMVREDRLVHGVNLEGEPGSGRTRIALSLAGAILCERQQGEMCGECIPCRKVLAGVHSDILLVNGREDPESFKVRPMRELRAAAYQGPSEGRAKVFILAEAQLLSRESQNVLLKVIEEPPEDTFFIFTCDNKHKLLPTILSRLVTFSIPPLGEAECLKRLEERVPGRTPEEYREAALLCCGSPGVGAEILAQPQTAKRARAARELAAAMAARNAYGAMAAATPFEKNRGEYAALLEAAARLCMAPALQKEWGISPARGAALRERLQQALERNQQNGYLPLITALLGAG
jgi:DNA polymerase-3 subunit delta'